jgi:hypothetical protein
VQEQHLAIELGLQVRGELVAHVAKLGEDERFVARGERLFQHLRHPRELA